MRYEVVFSKKAYKQIQKIKKSNPQSFLQIANVLKRAVLNDNPREIGKALSGSDLWRYRAGDFRILVKIQDENLIIKALKVAHRNEVYKNLDSI